MEFDSFYRLMNDLWVVWLTILFVGICVWTLRPSRKNRLESHADIPLRDD